MTASRRLRRFFISQPIPPPGALTYLPSSETRHLKKVLRLKQGDSCLITDGRGREAEALIQEFLKDGQTALKITISSLSPQLERGPRLRLRICQAMLQKGKMDFLIEKAQELGVAEFWPVETERSVVKMSREAAQKVCQRWRKIIQAAAKQSGSLNLVQMIPPCRWEDAMMQIPEGEPIAFFHFSQRAVSFEAWAGRLKESLQPGKIVNLCVGPEGGFTEQELARAEQLRKDQAECLQYVSLGENTLKAETACLALMAVLKLGWS